MGNLKQKLTEEEWENIENKETTVKITTPNIEDKIYEKYVNKQTSYIGGNLKKDIIIAIKRGMDIAYEQGQESGFNCIPKNIEL